MGKAGLGGLKLRDLSQASSLSLEKAKTDTIALNDGAPPVSFHYRFR
jgi:hypothetical protein